MWNGGMRHADGPLSTDFGGELIGRRIFVLFSIGYLPLSMYRMYMNVRHFVCRSVPTFGDCACSLTSRALLPGHLGGGS